MRNAFLLLLIVIVSNLLVIDSILADVSVPMTTVINSTHVVVSINGSSFQYPQGNFSFTSTVNIVTAAANLSCPATFVLSSDNLTTLCRGVQVVPFFNVSCPAQVAPIISPPIVSTTCPQPNVTECAGAVRDSLKLDCVNTSVVDGRIVGLVEGSRQVNASLAALREKQNKVLDLQYVFIFLIVLSIFISVILKDLYARIMRKTHKRVEAGIKNEGVPDGFEKV